MREAGAGAQALHEQAMCRDWLAEHRGEPETLAAELGASDWVKEELLVREELLKAPFSMV